MEASARDPMQLVLTSSSKCALPSKLALYAQGSVHGWSFTPELMQSDPGGVVVLVGRPAKAYIVEVYLDAASTTGGVSVHLSSKSGQCDIQVCEPVDSETRSSTTAEARTKAIKWIDTFDFGPAISATAVFQPGTLQLGSMCPHQAPLDHVLVRENCSNGRVWFFSCNSLLTTQRGMSVPGVQWLTGKVNTRSLRNYADYNADPKSSSPAFCASLGRVEGAVGCKYVIDVLTGQQACGGMRRRSTHDIRLVLTGTKGRVVLPLSRRRSQHSRMFRKYQVSPHFQCRLADLDLGALKAAGTPHMFGAWRWRSA